VSDFSTVVAGRSLELPTDYAALLTAYGPGAFRQYYAEVAVFSLGNQHPRYDIASSTRETADILNGLYDNLRDDWLPYPFWPEPGGLLQWGSAEVETLFWLTEGVADEWPVVVLRDTEQIYERVDMTATEVILGLIAGPSPTRLKSALTCPGVTFSMSPARVGDLYEDEA